MSDDRHERLKRQLVAERAWRARRQPSRGGQAKWAGDDTELPSLWAGRPRPGRPPGLTVIENDEQLWQAMRATRTADRKLTMENVAAVGGTFTYANLRSYLRVTGRSWAAVRAEFLHTS